MKPKISVIIPCYNSSKTLAEAVSSCYEQGFSKNDFEIVMVDDGSSDETRVLMETLSREYKNIKLVFHTHNQGGGAARNTAVANATSEVIFCLDSDDILPEQTLNKMYRHLLAKNCDGVGVAKSIKFAGKDKSNIQVVHEFNRQNDRILLKDLLQTDGLCSLYSTFMFTKTAFNKTSGYPFKHGFDTQSFAWRFLAAHLYAETCPDTSYLHRIHNNESYYLREFNAGKANYNWQEILKEHLNLFNDEAQRFITTFDCSDFTRDIFTELIAKDAIFSKDMNQTVVKDISIHKLTNPIKRNSLLGLYIRIRRRFKNIIIRNNFLKSVIVSSLLFTQDIRARLASKDRFSLVTAYLALRIRKIFHAGFIDTIDDAAEFDVIIPTLGKDFPLLKEYLTHLRKNLVGKINTVFIVAPAIGSEELQHFCNQNNITFVDEKTVIGYTPKEIDYVVEGCSRSGWLFQQLLKLSGEKITQAQKYIIVDSDTLLISPHNFFEKGKDCFFETNEWHPEYFSAFKRLFGYSAPHPLSLTSHMMAFDTARISEMKKEIEARHQMTWDKAYIQSCNTKVPSGISDYDTYAQWMLYNHPDEVLTKPFYNRSLRRLKITETKENLSKYQRHFKSLSFHSYNN